MAHQDTQSGATATPQTAPPDGAFQAAAQYQELAAHFDQTHEKDGLTYVTQEQVISRLNEVLGPDGWSFQIMERGHYAESDEVWCHGKLTAYFRGTDHPVVREQYGSQKIERASGKAKLAAGTVLDFGFNMKGAATDALKKCAMNIGVALYLSSKEKSAEEPMGEIPPCEDCGGLLTPVTFPDKTWSPGELANRGKRKFGLVVCWDHYKDRNRNNNTAPAQKPAQAPAQQRQAPQRAAGAPAATQPAKAPASAPPAQAPAAGAPAENGQAPADLKQHRERTDREWWATYQRARAKHEKAGLGTIEPIEQSQVNRNQLREMCESIKRKIDIAEQIDKLCSQHVDDMERVDGALLNLENLSEKDLQARYEQIDALLKGTSAATN